MSSWFLIVLLITFLASIFAIFVRMESRENAERIQEGELCADDFDIIE